MQTSLPGNDEAFILMNTLHSARNIRALVVVLSKVVGSAALRQGSLGLGAMLTAGSGSSDRDRVADSAMPSTCIVVSCSTCTRRSATPTRMAALSVNDSSWFGSGGIRAWSSGLCVRNPVMR
jgi:hypothetical protein